MKLIFCAQPTCNYNVFRCWRCLSCADVCLICEIEIHSGMSFMLCVVSILISISLMGLSFPSSWLCCDSQSAVNIFGPGLYRIWTLYWWIFNRMCCVHFNSVAMSFLNIATNGLWLVMMWTPWQNNNDDIFWAHAECLGPPFLCCYTYALHLLGLC